MHFKDGAYYLEDPKSTNHTFLNGKRLDKKLLYRLEPNRSYTIWLATSTILSFIYKSRP